MDALSWLFFIAVTLLFSTITGIVLKAALGKYLAFLIPIPLFFLIIFISLIMIALQAAGFPISSLYAAFFSWLSKLLGGTQGVIV